MGEQWGQGTASTDYKQTVLSPITAVTKPTGATSTLSVRRYVISFNLPGGFANPGVGYYFLLIEQHWAQIIITMLSI